MSKTVDTNPITQITPTIVIYESRDNVLQRDPM